MVQKKHNDINHLSIEEIEKQLKENRFGEINRRELLGKGARLLGGIALGGYIASRIDYSHADINWIEEKSVERATEKQQKTQKTKSSIVQIANIKSVDSSGNGKEGPVHDMLMKAIIQLTDETDKARAWRRIAQNGQRVGIKVNCIASPGLSTQVPVVMAIIEGLKLAGVLEKHIIIWDRTNRELKRGGYTLSKDTDSLRCYGTDGNYEDKENNINGTKFKLSKILTDEIDVLINVPIMKNHGGSGVSLSMKNHYGSHNNPGSHHGNNCDPFIADICSHPVIVDKTKLIVVDALRAQCYHGPSSKPGWQWTPGMLMLGYDPVAVDTIGSDFMDARRKEIGVDLIGNSNKHISTAAKLGLGTNDRSLIEVENLVVN